MEPPGGGRHRRRGGATQLELTLVVSAMSSSTSTLSSPATHRRPSQADALRGHRRRESADALLAKNLVAARELAGLTQHELAAAAGLSRATVAQLETGYSDPRLSTVVDLAAALEIPPILRLIGAEEIRALHEAATHADPLQVSESDLGRMLDHLQSGMLKDRLRAARLGASVARRTDPAARPATAIAAGILSAILPGPGTVIGAALGAALATPPGAKNAVDNGSHRKIGRAP